MHSAIDIIVNPGALLHLMERIDAPDLTAVEGAFVNDLLATTETRESLTITRHMIVHNTAGARVGLRA